MRWTGFTVRSETGYRNLLPKIEKKQITKIREEFLDQDFSLAFDETQDACSRNILNVVAVVLGRNPPQKPVLIDSLEIERLHC